MLILRGQILKVMKKREDKKYQKILFLGEDNFPRYVNIKPEKINEIKGKEGQNVQIKIYISNYGDRLIYFYAGIVEDTERIKFAEGF